MEALLKYFPREVGMPYRFSVGSKAEILKVVNSYNTIKTLYYSLYNCDKFKKYDNCNIDKIIFDLDEEDALEALKKLHVYCLQNKLKHLLVFSGRRYNFYLFTKNYKDIKNRKDCLRNSQEFIAKEAGLTINSTSTRGDIDFHLIGDIARVVRFPNSMHLKTGLYCIPLTHSDVKQGEVYINKKAKKQNFNFVFYGTELFDISKFDRASPHKALIIETSAELESVINFDSFLQKLPLCIAKMLVMEYVPWRCRFHIIVYLRENGYSLTDIYKILETYLKGKKHPVKGHDNFVHCIKTESNQIRRVYQSNNYFFSCDKIRNEIGCVKGCTHEFYL